MRNFTLDNIFNRAFVFFLILFAFSLPINYRLSIYLLAFSSTAWVLSKNWYYSRRKIFCYSNVIILVLYWCLHLISLVYSDDINRAQSDVIQKMSFLLFPLFFITSKDIIKHKRTLLDAFLLGLIFIATFLFFRAFRNSINLTDFKLNPIPSDTPWENYFLYLRFTDPYHPTYLSLYFSMGLAILVNKYVEISKMLYRFFIIFLFSFFLVIIYLSSSKAGLLVASTIFLLTVFWLIRKRSRLYASILVGVLSTVLVVFISNNSRFAYFINYLGGSKNKEFSFDNKELEKKLSSEATVRIDIWKNIPSIINDDWLFGVGVGDNKSVLVDGYREKGIQYAAEARLNAHNQYFETFVGLGLVGLIILLTIFGVGFWKAFQRKDMLLFMFLLIVSINFLFESMFERVFGVMFFSFFYCLLLLKEDIEKK